MRSKHFLFPTLVEVQRHEDHRGVFLKVFGSRTTPEFRVRQINVSTLYGKGTTKGFHLQSWPNSELKLLTCVLGEVEDFAIDLRRSSEEFGKIFKFRLNEQDSSSVLIPKGFGHGIQSLSEKSMVVYCHDKPWQPKYEKGVNILDPILNLEFSVPPTNLSARDRGLPTLREFKGA